MYKLLLLICLVALFLTSAMSAPLRPSTRSLLQRKLQSSSNPCNIVLSASTGGTPIMHTISPSNSPIEVATLGALDNRLNRARFSGFCRFRITWYYNPNFGGSSISNSQKSNRVSSGSFSLGGTAGRSISSYRITWLP